MIKKILHIVGVLCVALFFGFDVFSKLSQWDEGELELTKMFALWHINIQSESIFEALIDLGMGNVFIVYTTFFVAESIGTLFILFAKKRVLGASILAVTLTAYTLIMYPFWFSGGATFHDQANEYMKNVAILGALFLLISSSSVKKVYS